MPALIAEDVFAKVLKAFGGKDVLDKINTRIITGKLNLNGWPEEYQAWIMMPDKLRIRLNGVAIKRDITFDGERGWEITPAGCREIYGSELTSFRINPLFNPLNSLFTCLKEETSIEFKRKEKIDKKEAYVALINPSNNCEITIYFNARNYLPIKECIRTSFTESVKELIVHYNDWRKTDNIAFPFFIVQETVDQNLRTKSSLQIYKVELNVPIEENFFKGPKKGYSNEPYEVHLETIPRKIYKESNTVSLTEDWTFCLLVQEKYGRALKPDYAKIEFYSDEKRIKSVEFSAEALESIRGVRFTGLASQKEIFDLRHSFSEPASLKINQMVYTLGLSTPKGEKIRKVLKIPVSHYRQKTKLIFPVKGNVLVFCHQKTEWSQWYAIDVIPLGPKLEFVKRMGKHNEDFVAWEREIFAPADGEVVYARNDVPDNDRPTITRRDVFTKLPDPRWAIGGNVVVIDHGNGEFSFLAHLKQGSVRVSKGDKVKKGQIIGLLGNSGNSDAPHLHYHLMAGSELFRCDGLPICFENVFSPLIIEEPILTPLTSMKGVLILKAK